MNLKSVEVGGFPVVFFDQNTPAGEWRAQARCCEEQNIALHRNIAFALAVADLLQLPDDLPLMPAVTAGSNAKDSRRGKHHDRPLDLSARAS